MEKQRSSLFSIPLLREISFALLIKLIAIAVIAWAFFSDPLDLNNPSTSVEQHFGLPVPAASSPASAPTLPPKSSPESL